jgi:outer membrane protein OmpA-like peptidoglycan-associated protein/tetratricopeptide (TPR) repeat protein
VLPIEWGRGFYWLLKKYKMRLMPNIKQIIVSAVTGSGLLLGTLTYAQFSSDYRKAADNYFIKGDYASAANYYEKYLGDGKTRQREHDPYIAVATKKAAATGTKQQAVYQLAESWRQLKNYEKAAPLYRQVAENYTAFPLALYHYATSLRALARYEEAEKALQSFLNTYEPEDQYKLAARREIKNLVYIQQQLQKETSAYTIHALNEGRTGASYAPVQLGQDTLLFTATWPDSSAPANKVHTNRLYKASYTQGALTTISRANIPASQLHEGAAAISADGNSLYVTKWAITGGHKAAAIYRSQRTAGGWSEPVALDSIVNTAGANTQQPFIMPDGQHLLYASDRPGGFGGYDLWMAELDASGKPVSSSNLGSRVNSAFNEQAPYFHPASATLVFASDGRTGMGGYDLFYTKGGAGNWSEPENFGYPVNSIKDDLYFTSYSKGRRILEEVVLSSDRADVCCLELFGLKKKNPLKLVIGKIIACDTRTPLPGVTVEVTDTVSGRKLFSGITNEEGSYSFTVEQALPLSSMATLKGYHPASRPLQLPSDADADSLVSIPVCIEKEVEIIEEVQVLNNVYYEFAKAEIKIESYPSLDEVVALLQKRADIRVEIGGHTDDKGSDELNLKLSEARAANVVTYLVSKGIDKNRLTSKGYGATMPIAPNKNEDGTDNPAGREKNRRTEMKILK